MRQDKVKVCYNCDVFLDNTFYSQSLSSAFKCFQVSAISLSNCTVFVNRRINLRIHLSNQGGGGGISPVGVAKIQVQEWDKMR